MSEASPAASPARPGADRALPLLVGSLALVAAAAGLLAPTAYTGLVTETAMPAALARDATTVVAALVLLVLACVRTTGPRRRAVELGLVAYLAYAYAVLTLQRVYNDLYPVYLAVFALAVWTLALAARGADLRATMRGRRVTTAVCALGAAVPPVVLVPLRVGALVPLMVQRSRGDGAYSVAILDLAFVLPAFALAAVLLLLHRTAGLPLGAALFVLGALLTASLAGSAFAEPLFGGETLQSAWLPPAVLAGLLLLLAVLALHGMRAPSERRRRAPAPPVPQVLGDGRARMG